MREIKFRVWDNTTKSYLKDFVIYQQGNVSSNNVWLQSEEAIIEQYTGLKDKNGTEIYEGDIINGEDYIHTGDNYFIVGYVEMIDGEWVIVDKEEDYPKMTYPIYSLGSDYIEVIGNIHENAELLEK